jgi:hypothetical protein
VKGVVQWFGSVGLVLEGEKGDFPKKGPMSPFASKGIILMKCTLFLISALACISGASPAFPRDSLGMRLLGQTLLGPARQVVTLLGPSQGPQWCFGRVLRNNQNLAQSSRVLLSLALKGRILVSLYILTKFDDII